MDLSTATYGKCDRCREGKMESYDSLCYYHQKIADGLIDEPEMEVALVEVWSEDGEELQIFLEQLDVLASLMCPDDWVEDAKQYASIGYRNVLSKWDPDNNAWRTHASMHIKGRLIDYMRKEGLYAERMQSLGGYEDLIEDPLDIEDMYAKKEIIDRLYNMAKVISIDLSDLELRILWHRLLTYDPISQSTIADVEGVSQQAVSKAEDRIINRLREAFNEI